MTRPVRGGAPYVALYGSHGGQWRRRAVEMLDAAGVRWHDPTDERWNAITHENGDAHQALIDQLVREEHESLLAARCVVFHLVGGSNPPPALAARLELGLLAGSGIQTFVSVDPQAQGRNYLWAACALYPHLVRCGSLDEAVTQAIEALT